MVLLRTAPVLLLTATLLSGCSKSNAVVKGKVTTGGQPVTAGGVVLTPQAGQGNSLPGKAGMADVRKDGTFSIDIEPGADGLAKKFTVHYTPPPIVNSKDGSIVTPYQGYYPKDTEIELKPGANNLEIELLPPG